MKKNISTAILLFIVVSLANTIQAQTFYKTENSDKVYTKTEYNNYKTAILNQLKKKYDEKIITIDDYITDSIVSNDSIIKTYKLNIKINRTKASANRPKEKIYNYINKKLPKETLNSIDGKEISLAQLKGKPIVLNIWFTRCRPCIEEIPILNKLAEKYANKVHFIAITYDNKEIVSKFLEKKKFNYLNVINARKFINTIGVNGYPKNIFIDKNGIVKKIEGGIKYFNKNGKNEIGNGDEFEAYIKELL